MLELVKGEPVPPSRKITLHVEALNEVFAAVSERTGIAVETLKRDWAEQMQIRALVDGVRLVVDQEPINSDYAYTVDPPDTEPYTGTIKR